SPVACARLLEANLGRSERMIMNVKRPFASYIAAPFGLGPHGSTLLPSGFTSWAETNIQVPTSWSLIDFCSAATLLGNKPTPHTIGTDLVSTLRRFMSSSFSKAVYS